MSISETNGIGELMYSETVGLRPGKCIGSGGNLRSLAEISMYLSSERAVSSRYARGILLIVTSAGVSGVMSWEICSRVSGE